MHKSQPLNCGDGICEIAGATILGAMRGVLCHPRGWHQGIPTKKWPVGEN